VTVAAKPPILTTPISEATSRSHAFVRVVAGATAINAALVVLIWFAHLDGVMRVLPVTVVTKANGAIALLLIATALLLQRGWRSAGPRRTAARLLALACLLIAAATTAEWLTGMDLGIDQALVRDWNVDSVFPGRPTLIGSGALILLAIAVLAGTFSKRFQRVRETSALVVVALGMISISGQVTGVAGFASGNALAPASALTAVGVVFCGVAVLVVGNSGTFAALVRKGPAGSLARGLTLASITAPLALGAVAVAAERAGIVVANTATAFVVSGTILLGACMAMVAARATGGQLEEIAAAANALRVSEQRQRLLIENLPQAIIFKDMDGVVVSANQSVRSQLGIEPEALVGRRLDEIASPALAKAYADHKRVVLETHEPLILVDELDLPAGQRAVEVRNIPALDDAGQVVGLLLMIADVTAQRDRERTVRRLAAIVDSADDAITSADTKGVLTSWNAGAERMFGWTASEAIGGTRALIVPPEFLGEAAALSDAVIAGSPVTHAEAVRVTRDGTRIDLSLTASAVLDDAGAVVGYSMIARNIGPQKRAQAALERTRQELERSNRELQDFASVASHDLQEPLRKIRAFGDRLQRRVGDSLDADSRDDIVRIQGAAARMQLLIEDLLSFARVTSRAQPFIPVDLARTLASVLENLESSVEENGGQVLSGALPTLDADASQMRQLFQNLVGNGLKFHPPDRAPIVTLTATATQLPASDGTSQDGWQIDVADNGIGFEARFAERIFAPFERLHGRTEFPGTGIGLAICRKIALRHGGTITVDSTPGSGTTFHVLLPARHVPVPVPDLPVMVPMPALAKVAA